MVVHDETTFFNARVLIGLYLGLLYETGCTGSVPFRVRIHTITLSVHLNSPFRLQALTGKRIQRAALRSSAQ